MSRRPNARTPRSAGVVLALSLAALLALGRAGGVPAPALASAGPGTGPGASAASVASPPVAKFPGTAAARAGHHPRKRRKKRVPLKFALGPGLLAAPGVSLSLQPVGLSIEYPTMAAALGSGVCPPPALAAQLERLGSPPIEIAGASQDMTAPSGALSGPQPSWQGSTLYSLPAAFWSQLHCLLQASKDPLTVGLNMKTGSPAWAHQIAAEADAAALSPPSFSLGNEPDLYTLPNYAALDKPLPGEEAAAASLYIALAGELGTSVAGAPLIGPELALPERWRVQLPSVLKAVPFQTVGVHLYPLTACASPRAVTIGGLLSTSAAEAPARLSWVVADAQAAGLPAIISEANSASCGGVAGVSDSPASAVWAVRFVLAALQSGFREVRFHLSGNSYDPFVVRGSEVLQRPLEDALVALNQWLPVGASVHRLVVPPTRKVDATAIAEPAGGLVLLLDNRGSHAQPLVLTSAGSLRAQALSSTRAGLAGETLTPVHGRVALSLPAETLLAISGAE